MDFETWLYLFIILISIIVPIVKKANKKKKIPQDHAEPEEVEEDIFETFKQQLMRSKEAQQQIPVPEYIEEPKDDFLNYDDYDVEESNQEAPKKEEHLSVFADKEAKTNEEDDNYSTVSEDKDGSEGDARSDAFKFDPVDAVIYSEILKRPEY